MHTWPSKRVMKTSTSWRYTPPKGLAGKDLQEWYASERDYKRTMLDIVIKEPKNASKLTK
jgi:hypothetical protein